MANFDIGSCCGSQSSNFYYSVFSQSCFTPLPPWCRSLPCPPGDPGWSPNNTVKVAVTRGENHDTVLIDWEGTVLKPGLVTYVIVSQRKYIDPLSPLRIEPMLHYGGEKTGKKTVCLEYTYVIRMGFNSTEEDHCYHAYAVIPAPRLKDFFAMDQEVTIERIENSLSKYKVN